MFTIEFPINVSPKMLYQYISSASGLSEWFADNVNAQREIFTFIWDGTEEKALLMNKKQDCKIKFCWLDENNNETDNIFELKIDVDELTKDVTLVITDTCDENDIEDQKLLWENQVNDLKKIVGSN